MRIMFLSTLLVSVRAFHTASTTYCFLRSHSITAPSITHVVRRSMTSTDGSADDSSTTTARAAASTTTLPTESSRSASLSSISSLSVPGSESPMAQLPPIASTAKRLFLVRHGEVINPGGDRPVYYGAQDVPLSFLGEQEAIAAAQYLSQFTLQQVASSPLKRAIFGAERVLEYQQLRKQQQEEQLQMTQAKTTYTTNNDETTSSSTSSPLMILPGFTELDRGAWCGLTKDEIGPEMMDRFDACDESVTPEGGESYPTLKARVLQARDMVLDQTSLGNASAIVSHLQVTRSMLSDAIHMPITQMATLKIATASITCIDYDVDTKTQTVHYQSFKPNVGLDQAKDGAN